MHFKIKVCGITRPKYALTAVSLGADMVGMIFHRRSPRWVPQAMAKKTREVLPATVRAVGVFVEQDVEQIARTAERLKLDFVQLHGQYTIGDVRRLQSLGLKVIRVHHIGSAADYKAVYCDRADLVLLDNRSETAVGGTGQRFDWGLKPPRLIPNLVLAGGISADNVEEGVRQFRPLVVDVNSGVEKSPGIKSPAKLRRFFEVCNGLRYGR